MARSKKIPLRKCVGCQEMKNKKDLLRIVLTGDGQILFDQTGKLNGRGAYVCRNIDCLERAEKSGGLSRSFKMKTDPSVLDYLKEELKKHDTE